MSKLFSNAPMGFNKAQVISYIDSLLEKHRSQLALEKDKLSQMSEEKEKVSLENNEFKESVAAKDAEIAEISAKLLDCQQVEADNSTLTDENLSLRLDLEKIEAEREVLRLSAQGFSAQAEDLQAQLDGIKVQLATMKTDFADLKSENDSLKAEKDRVSLELEQSKRLLEAEKEENARLKEEKSTLSGEIQLISNHLIEKENALIGAEAIASQQADIKAEYDSLMARYEDKKEKEKALAFEISSLKDEIKELSAENSQLSDEIAEFDKGNVAIEENECLNTQIVNLTNEKLALQNEIDDLTKAVVQLTCEIEELEKTTCELNVYIEEIQNTQQSKASDLQHELVSVTLENQKLYENYGTAQERVKKLEAKIRQLEAHGPRGEIRVVRRSQREEVSSEGAIDPASPTAIFTAQVEKALSAAPCTAQENESVGVDTDETWEQLKRKINDLAEGFTSLADSAKDADTFDKPHKAMSVRDILEKVKRIGEKL